jgi:hypothetical protein
MCLPAVHPMIHSASLLMPTATNQPTKDLTEGGDLREAQVYALGLYSHSCLDGIAGSVTDI